jgi:CubicO group peptidase (beta-lactamase class C family)
LNLKKTIKIATVKTLKLILCLLTSSFLAAQSSEKSVIDSAIKTYNNKGYSSFYDLLSPAFKSQMSQKDLANFLNDNVYTYYGAIKSITFKNEKQRQKFYTTQFEKGILDLMLVFNTEFKIDGLSFTPPKDEIVEKKDILTSNTIESKLDSIVDDIVRPFIKNSVNSGISIGIIQDGKTAFYHYGETKKETTNLPNNNTIYEIGSISKTFTGYLLAQAIADKKVNLDDDIRKFLSQKYTNLEFEGSPILIKHLINHTSTLPRLPEDLDKQANYDEQNPYANYSKEMISSYLKNFTMKSKPGINQEYSNFGVALLGILLENVYKKPYNVLLQTYLTRPFKMKNTVEKLSKFQTINFATGYNDKGFETKHWDLANFVAAGGIKSTIEDMTIYLQQNIDETNPNIKLSHEITFENEKVKAGYAWVIQQTKSGDTLIWHNGGTYGFTSFCGFIKEKKYGIVVLNNSGLSVDSVAISILKKL